MQPSMPTGMRYSYEDHYNAWRPSYTSTGYRPPAGPRPAGQHPPFPRGVLDPYATSVTEVPAPSAVGPAQAEVPSMTPGTARPCYPLQPDC